MSFASSGDGMRTMTKRVIAAFIFMLLLTAPAYAANLKLLFFYRDNCKWCALMEQVINEPSIKEILRNSADVIKVDVFGNRKIAGEGVTGTELAGKYGVMGTPTLVFLGPGKREVMRVPGVLTKEDFKDLLCRQVRGINRVFCAK